MPHNVFVAVIATLAGLVLIAFSVGGLSHAVAAAVGGVIGIILLLSEIAIKKWRSK
ncbi:hypothetical protein [Paremcibacter congregatus]|uniref:hypothetical protein n=1 Tax=Paremcibacter congregatus TaxID=2043170 RepID=UPI0030EB7DDB|tara:strand:- start:1185 stop:1352 length:168 start_codon:yes stop_codon:yes gene_type:complete